MKLAFRLLPLSFFAPLLALAQTFDSGSRLKGYITAIMNFMNDVLVPLVFALAFLVFLWGMFQTFILGGGDEEKQTKGKQLMMYAIAGFVIMVSVWGIVNFFANILGFNNQQTIGNIPDITTNN